MDAMEQLTFDATEAAAVMARPDSGEAMLLFLNDDLERSAWECAKGGLCFVGVVALVGGEVRFASEPDLESRRKVLQALPEFVKRATERQSGDAVDWLRKLFALPDERSEFGPA
jgi:hypothetical protein